MFKNLKRAIARFTGRATIVGVRSEPPVIGTQQFLEAYDTSPGVRAMSSRVATKVGQTRWKLVRTDTSADVPNNHLLLRTLRKPNPLMSGMGLIRVTQLSLDLAGDAFWLLVRNGFGAPVEYWPIPAHWVADLPNATRDFFRISWQQWQAQIPSNEIIWIHELSPSNPYGRGHGIIQALADEVQADEFAAKHVGSLFFNRASPEFVVQDPNATDEELKIYESNWTARLQGLYKAMRPYFVNRKLEFWQPAQQNLENLTLVPLRRFERDIQLQTWGIPPEQLGIVENSNRATIEASTFIFEDQVIQPRRQFLADELTLKLAPMYDPRLELTFVDTTPRDKEFEAGLMKALPAAFRVNEIRELTGREPIEDGDVRIVPTNQYAVTDLTDTTQRPQSGQIAQEAPEPAPPESAPAPKPSPEDEKIRKFVRRLMRERGEKA